MGLRERIEQQVRAAIRDAKTHGGGRINVVSRVNKVVVRNVGASGGGAAEATAEQTAPIVQEPPSAD
jgi:hypothetical protein